MTRALAALVLFTSTALAQELPQPTGPFHVGRASFSAVDRSRDHRVLLFEVWYPTDAASGTVAPYVDVVPDDDLFRRSYSFVGIERVAATRAHGIAGAPLSSSRRRYPVLLFSHGLGMVAGLYSTLLENLASHGYVVFGTNHPNFSSAMRLPDGRVVKNESRRPWPGADATPEQYAEMTRIREAEAIVQAQDLRFALDELARTAGPFRGRLDLSRVGVFGHSRGGFAAPHACLLDRRFDACLNLDGYRLTEAVMQKGIRQPYMHIEESTPWDEGATEPAAERAATFARMRGGAYLVTVKGARHASFSDGPFIAPEKYPGIAIGAKRALEITNAYVLAFFDRHVRGLHVTMPSFPEATLEVYGRASR